MKCKRVVSKVCAGVSPFIPELSGCSFTNEIEIARTVGSCFFKETSHAVFNNIFKTGMIILNQNWLIKSIVSNALILFKQR